MAARAIWKGVIRLDDVRIPVKLYSAVEDKNIHFHLLHDQDMVRVKQRMVHPDTGETVPYDQMRKGYEIERHRLVVLDEEELESLQPPASRDINIAGFVDPAQITHPWYDRPYWLGPDGDEDRYFALAESLINRNVEGIACWTMRKKEYVGALRGEQGYLSLITLRHAAEIISSDQFEPPEGRKLDKKEVKLAGQLIAALEADFDPAEYHDEYRERVRELIDKKRKGETVEVEEYEEAPPVKSLADSLEASLQGLK